MECSMVNSIKNENNTLKANNNKECIYVCVIKMKKCVLVK